MWIHPKESHLKGESKANIEENKEERDREREKILMTLIELLDPVIPETSIPFEFTVKFSDFLCQNLGNLNWLPYHLQFSDSWLDFVI